MTTRGDTRPLGFAGAIDNWHDLLPEHHVCLPRDGISDGASLRLPDGPIDALFVAGWSESLGNVERFVHAARARLVDGGRLFVDVANLHAPAALRDVLEGNPGAFEPVGSWREPERRLSPRRLVEALERAGFVVEDVYRVPTPCGSITADAAQHLLDAGFVASGWLGQLPPSRVWVVASRSNALAGSVLIGPGSDEAQRRTRDSVARVLPPRWEVVDCDGDAEPSAFNRGVTRARGEVICFLRAGATFDAAFFNGLRRRVTISPAASDGRGDAAAADPSGIMLTRRDVLLTGPFATHWRSACVAYEEWGMRLQSVARALAPVPGAFRSPPPPSDAATLRAESQALLDGWRLPESPSVAATDAVEPPWRGRRPRLSLCMIARDEEHFLPECLQRVAPAVDEIVLVDTGSTDRTIEIAESFGARVLQRPWDDDFAAPRNCGIDAATGDWILVLDADEFLEADGVAALRAAIEDPSISGYHLVFHNVYSGAKSQGVTMVRLFRRLEGVRFQNAIHEQVTPSLMCVGAEAGLRLATSDIKVLHYGYGDDVMASRSKNERNERLFRKQLEKHPDDVYSLYKYGDFLRRYGDRGEAAIELLQRALQVIWAQPPAAPRGVPYAGEIAALCALEHAKLGRTQDADAIVERALRTFAPTPNLLYVAASLALSAGRSDEAIAHFERCFAYRDRILVVPVQEGITSHVALVGIAQARLQQGDVSAASDLLEQAVALAPDYEIAVMTMSKLRLQLGDRAGALQSLTEFLGRNPEAAGVCQQASLILLKCGFGEQARAMGWRAVELLEKKALPIEAQRMREQLAAIA